MSTNLLIGFVFSLMVTTIAYRRNSLNQSGRISALILGTLVYGLGHWIFYVFMMFFFTSSLVIRKVVTALYPAAHRSLMHHHQKHEARTWVQVIANGGLLALISAAYALKPSMLLIFVAALSMAAATSDTWASEIGVLSHEKPKSLLKRQTMETGLSGGVTPLGLWASLAGSALIALVYGLYAVLTNGFSFQVILVSGLCTLGGFTGSLFDSVLGELFQAKYRTIKAEIVEVSTTAEDVLIQGWRWFDNNLVNFLSNVFIVGCFSALAFWSGWIL